MTPTPTHAELDALKCHDCDRLYSAPGFPDLVIPHDVWARISPSGDEGGLLCPSCICARLERANITTTGMFTSGPLSGSGGDVAALRADNARLRQSLADERAGAEKLVRDAIRPALIAERRKWWSPEYPGQAAPVLAVWWRDEPESGLSGFDTQHDRDAFASGEDGPFIRRVTGNEFPQIAAHSHRKEIK